MIKISDERNCVGCLACEKVCPKNAIEKTTNSLGFIYPKINYNKCINCGLCDKVCPTNNFKSNNNKEPKCFLAWNKNDNIRKNSTSGGVFTALMNYIFDEKGVICGVTLDENFNVKHTVINCREDMKAFSRAKYVQSSLDNTFVEIKSYLDDNIKVLFSGTPCQVSGLYNYLGKDYVNLYTVEVICHGVVSQEIFNSYLRSLTLHYNSTIENYEFRNKDISWMDYTSKVTVASGKIYQNNRLDDPYMMGYLKHSLYLRPSCTKCMYKSFPRIADITLGDFWGIEKIKDYDTELGVSAVIVNSEHGFDIISRVKEQIYCERVDLSDIIKGNPSLIKSSTAGKYTDYFCKKYEKIDFIDLIHKIDFKDTINRSNLRLIDKLYLLKKYYVNK